MTTSIAIGNYKPVQKRLIVCCDGTWMNSDEGTARGDGGIVDSVLGLGGLILQQPTNVTRLCRALKGSARNNTVDGSQEIKQISYYQAGIGTADILSKVQGGLTGEGEAGLAEHIREAYQFIAANYSSDSNDEIILVGFSRGAFTARSVAAFINDIGLLTPKGMTFFYPIFEDWENQQRMLRPPPYKPSFPNYPFPGPRPHMFPDPTEYRNKLVSLGYTRPNIRIKAVAVYDTVGSLGVPRIDFWKDVSAPHHSLDFAFVDASVPSCVDNAIHALALDEIRRPFAPTMWENPTNGQTLTQVWFCGSHADVGGSYNQTAAANITLAWMVARLSKFVEFDDTVLQNQFDYPSTKDKRAWSCGVLHNEFASTYEAFGSSVRTPGAYTRYNHNTGEPFVPPQPLQNTNEKIHASVRIRCGVPGHKPETAGKTGDTGKYIVPVYGEIDDMENWKMKGLPKEQTHTGNMGLEDIHELQKRIRWVRDESGNEMEEDLIGDGEWKLLKKLSPEIADNFFAYRPN